MNQNDDGRVPLGEGLEELAARVESLTVADREIDAEIALALGIVRERDGDCFYGHRDHSMLVLERHYYDHGGNAPELPHYTASLDAAMSLVPGGENPCEVLMEAIQWNVGDDWVASLPRYICAAALRSRLTK